MWISIVFHKHFGIVKRFEPSQIGLEAYGDRQASTDPWLQHSVTRPSDEAVEKYQEELALFKEREKGHPSAPTTVRMAFIRDPAVLQEVTRRMQSAGGGSDSASGAQISVSRRRTKMANQLFEKESLRAGGLGKYTFIEEKDIEGYAKELKHFKEVVQRTLDK